MKNISGIEFRKDEKFAFFYIEFFSDELKELIRNRLSEICHGKASAESGRNMYSYEKTVLEFTKRYNDKIEIQRIGLIGELLIHIVLREYLTEYEALSPFFNLEERGVKKGFDVVLMSKKDSSLWITEVKSGKQHSGKDASGTTLDLINTAKRDLNTRLNKENFSLWLNAIHGAKVSLHETTDFKNAVIRILEDCGDRSSELQLTSSELNVLLASNLFNPMSEKFDETKVQLKQIKLENKQIFKGVFVLSLQKETYQKVFDFLAEEGAKFERTNAAAIKKHPFL